MNATYLASMRKISPHKSDVELELAASMDRDFRAFTGKSAHTHRRIAMEGLFPNRVWHDWREERMQSIQQCLEGGIQELTWMGSSNSNKSADMADAALALWWTKPENTTIYVTSPYESATELGLWAYIVEQFGEARDYNPGLPGKLRTSDNSIVHHDRNPRSFIRVVTVDQIGKMVGKKSRDFGQGLMIILADELPAFSATASRNFLAVTKNLWSVPNLLIIAAGNFAHTGDALGIFAQPDEDDIPNGYDGFDPDTHFRWRTVRKGLALRFDGLRSPNVIAGRDIYPFVTTLAYIEKLASQPGGLSSPDSMRFVRSSPITSLDEFTILNGERIRAAGSFDDYEWTGDPITSLAFFDPGFGGDPCIYQKFKLGNIATADGGSRQVLALWDAPHVIPIRVGLKDDAGVLIPAEDQVVAGARELTERFQIAPGHVGYDGSMRAGLAQKVAAWSLQVVPLDSQGPATTRAVSVTEKKEDAAGNKLAVTWKDKVDRLLSEFWFAASHAVDSMQIRGLGLSPKAVQQLCQRRWNWSGRKKRVQTKEEYRETLRDSGKPVESPNEADAFVGGVEMARRLGMAFTGLNPGGGALRTILDMIRDRGRHQLRDFAENLGKRETLTSAGLHSMKPTTRTSLHRARR